MIEVNKINIFEENLRVWIEDDKLNNFLTNRYAHNDFTFVLQGWEYSINKNFAYNPTGSIYVELKPGMVDFVSSRETLDFTKRTNNLIEEIKKQLSSDKYKKEVFDTLTDEQRIKLVINDEYEDKDFEDKFKKLANEKPTYADKVFLRIQDKEKYKLFDLDYDNLSYKIYPEMMRVRDIIDLDTSEKNINFLNKNHLKTLVLYNSSSMTKVSRVSKNYETGNYKDLVIFTDDIKKFKENVDKRFFNDIIYLDVEEEFKKYKSQTKKRREFNLIDSTDCFYVKDFEFDKYNMLRYNKKTTMADNLKEDDIVIILSPSDNNDYYINSLGYEIDLTEQKGFFIVKTNAPKSVYENIKVNNIYVSNTVLSRSKTLENKCKVLSPSFDRFINKKIVNKNKDNIIGRCLQLRMGIDHYYGNEKVKKYDLYILNKFLKSNNIDFKAEENDDHSQSYYLLSQSANVFKEYKDIENEFLKYYNILHHFIKHSLEYNIIEDGSKKIDDVINMVL